jgi:hypothetical protein
MDVITMRNPNKKAIRNKTRCDRRAGTRLGRTWRFEQLESRAMLSATIGPTMGTPMPVYTFEIQSFQETYVSQAGMFAPPEFGMRFDMAPAWSDGPVGPMRGEHHDEHAMFGGPPPSQYMWDFDPTPIQHSSLTSLNKPTEPAGPPPIDWDVVEYTYSFPVAGFVVDQHIYESADSPKGTPAYAQQQQGTLPGAGNNHIYPGNNNGSPANGITGNNSNGSVSNPIGPQHGGLGILYLNPIVTQTSGQSTSHESDIASLISSSTVDAALQTFTAPSLFATGSATTQPTIATSLSDATTGELNDDFIRLGDAPMASDAASSSDALSREQAAIEEILESLQGVDSIPNQAGDASIANDNSTSADQDAQATDLAFASAFELANADGGMLLLQMHGDANESPINLANVAESHPDMFSPHAVVEVSVGFYQAIDRGVEEFTGTEVSAAATPTVAPLPASKPDNRLTTGREASGRKAAAVVTASTLAGALLWCASNERSDDDRNAKSRRDVTLAR